LTKFAVFLIKIKLEKIHNQKILEKEDHSKNYFLDLIEI